jgi:hypothetical protein
LRKKYRLRVFENRVLRRIFGPKRDEVTGEWRRLHNEELNDLCTLPNIVRSVNSRRIRWAEHVARMGRGEVRTAYWRGKLKNRSHLEDLELNGRVILKWILKNTMGRGLD